MQFRAKSLLRLDIVDIPVIPGSAPGYQREPARTAFLKNVHSGRAWELRPAFREIFGTGMSVLSICFAWARRKSGCPFGVKERLHDEIVVESGNFGYFLRKISGGAENLLFHLELKMHISALYCSKRRVFDQKKLARKWRIWRSWVRQVRFP
jgi:hypothetical protein